MQTARDGGSEWVSQGGPERDVHIFSLAGNGRVVKKNLLLVRYPFERLSKSFKRGELQRGWGEKVTTRTNRARARRPHRPPQLPRYVTASSGPARPLPAPTNRGHHPI